MSGRICPDPTICHSNGAAPIKSAAIVPNQQNAIDTGNFSPSFYQEKLQFDITPNLHHVKNLLLFHGDADATVPVSHGQTIYAIASEPKKLIVQAGGDHRMSRSDYQREFIAQAADWYQTRLTSL